MMIRFGRAPFTSASRSERCIEGTNPAVKSETAEEDAFVACAALDAATEPGHQQVWLDETVEAHGRLAQLLPDLGAALEKVLPVWRGEADLIASRGNLRRQLFDRV